MSDDDLLDIIESKPFFSQGLFEQVDLPWHPGINQSQPVLSIHDHADKHRPSRSPKIKRQLQNNQFVVYFHQLPIF